MSTWGFYIGLKLKPEDSSILLQEYNNNVLYKSTFHFGIAEQYSENEFNAEISSVIDNFLPVNTLIYKFISMVLNDTDCLYIKTKGIERIFDFEKNAIL